MKKLLTFGCLSLFIFACGEQDANKTDDDNETAVACDAKDIESAANCLCDLYNRQDNSAELSDEEYEQLMDELDAFNRKIDDVIAIGTYSEMDLTDAVDKSCP